MQSAGLHVYIALLRWNMMELMKLLPEVLKLQTGVTGSSSANLGRRGHKATGMQL